MAEHTKVFSKDFSSLGLAKASHLLLWWLNHWPKHIALVTVELWHVSAVIGLMTQIRENTEKYLKKPKMCFEAQPWYLSWGWQDLQDLLAGPQLRWNTHILGLGEQGLGLQQDCTSPLPSQGLL